LDVVGSSLIKASVVSMSRTLYTNCLVLVSHRNGFEREFTIKPKQVEGLMED